MTNPILGSNRLRLGTFCTNGTGAAITLAPEVRPLTWANTLKAARLADAAGYEAIVSFARWKGYDEADPLKPSGVVMDPYTWAAGLAQATSHSALIATSHASTIHPVVAAKQLATIDLISNGRVGLNVVAGWHQPELELFWGQRSSHEDRYAYLEEWLQVLLRLFDDPDEFDHEGEFFELRGAISNPKPIQRPHPPIMNAGNSPRGVEFASQYADMCFTLLDADDSRQIVEAVDRYKRRADELHGRSVQVWAHAFVVQQPSQEAADRYLNRYAVEYEDAGSMNGWMRVVGRDLPREPPELVQAIRKRFAAGAGGFPLVGTAETVADRLELLSDCGVDGVLLTWVDYIDGLERFNEHVLPILEQRGLRAPFRPSSDSCLGGDLAPAGPPGEH